jgi:hypothetical protein
MAEKQMLDIHAAELHAPDWKAFVAVLVFLILAIAGLLLIGRMMAWNVGM